MHFEVCDQHRSSILLWSEKKRTKKIGSENGEIRQEIDQEVVEGIKEKASAHEDADVDRAKNSRANVSSKD